MQNPRSVWWHREAFTLPCSPSTASTEAGVVNEVRLVTMLQAQLIFFNDLRGLGEIDGEVGENTRRS